MVRGKRLPVVRHVYFPALLVSLATTLQVESMDG